jgi:cytochrome c oxidase subunit 2
MSRHRPRARWLLMGSALLASAFMLAACETATPYSTIVSEGSHAQNILALLKPVSVAALVVFLLVEGLLVYSVIRFRRRSQAMPAQTHGNTRVEILWTIAPAIIVLVIAVLTFRTQAINSVQPPGALRVEVIGHQWFWEFRYPEQNIITANDLYIPVGRDVNFVLDSVDVIHSFWVPRLAGKTDLIPNNTNYISFRAEQEGIYRGECAEFCGEEHALMRFRVIAVAPDVFDRWAAEHATPPQKPAGDYVVPTAVPRTTPTPGAPTPTVAPTPTPPSDPAARGQITFIRKGCVGCHVIDGVQQAKGQTGPNLTYFGSRTTIAAGVLPNTPENLRSWLHDPGAIKPGNLMAAAIKPGVLTDQEINDLIAYLDGMKLENVPLPPER